MVEKEKIEQIKKEVGIFFKQADFTVEVEISPEKNSVVQVNIDAEDPQILIGEGGQTLFEIQHLLRAILRRKIINIASPEALFYFDLDINNYKKKKAEYLKELARLTADEVSLAKKEKSLGPMTAYERRIIHLELSQHPNITTESAGQEPQRRIIVKPRSAPLSGDSFSAPD